MQLHDLPDLLRYCCPSAQGFLPQRPRRALLVPGVGTRIHSFWRWWIGATRLRRPL